MSNNLGIVAKDKEGRVKGRLVTLALAVDFELGRNPRHDPQNPNSPVFQVLAKGPDGSPVSIGSCWAKESKKDRRKFYSMTIDDPSMDRPINTSLFQQPDGTWDIVWNRPRLQARDVKPDPGRADDDADSHPLDDEIPF